MRGLFRRWVTAERGPQVTVEESAVTQNTALPLCTALSLTVELTCLRPPQPDDGEPETTALVLRSDLAARNPSVFLQL